MTVTDIAYAAGIVDGEGSIVLERRDNRRSLCPGVSVTSTDRELLDWLRSMFGGLIVVKKKSQLHHNQAWDWRLKGNHALKFLALIRPFLRIRRKIARANMLCDGWKAVTPRNGRYTAAMAAGKAAFQRDFLAA